MAKATIAGGINVKTLKLAHTSAVERDEVIVSNGQVLVAVNTAASGVDNAYVHRGAILFPKEADLAIDPGDVCYWVAATNINKTSAGNTKAGICIEKALAADTEVLVDLEPNK